MSRKSTLGLAAALLLALAWNVQAQTKTLTGEMTTVKGSVEAIDHAKRVLTVRGPGGNFVTIDVPSDVKRFPEIKVGDSLVVRYYDNVVVRLKPAGEPAVDSASETLTPGTGERPAGTGAKQRTITATITAIDKAAPSITFEGPNGWKYSRRVTDAKALAQVKVGDRVDITWTQAVLIEIEGQK